MVNSKSLPNGWVNGRSPPESSGAIAVPARPTSSSCSIDGLRTDTHSRAWLDVPSKVLPPTTLVDQLGLLVSNGGLVHGVPFTFEISRICGSTGGDRVATVG